MKHFNLFFFFFFFASLALSQTLLQVNGNEIDVDTFKRAYEQSERPANYSEESVNDYLQLFIAYQVKLAEAREKGIPELQEVQEEIAGYENQLVKNELDKQMMNDLIDEAYERLQEEICASHILIHVKRNPSPIDTSLAYKQALKLREQLTNGASFGQLAQKHSADIDTKFDQGNMGCFTALQLSSYHLENAIYQLEEGELSMPVRTRFGYHIIQVNERRKTHGLVAATQLFARANNTQSKAESLMAKQVIQKAHRQLKNGVEFSVVRDSLLNYRDTLEVSADAIDWFSVGTYESDFENAVFSISEPGKYSEPVQTSLGWHVFRLDNQKPLPTKEEMRERLVIKIKQDERYFKAKLAYSESLKQDYQFEKNNENIQLFIEQVARGIDIPGWQIPSIYDLNNQFFTIGEQQVSAKDFVDYVKKEHANGHFHSFSHYYNSFESEHLLTHHKQELIQSDSALSLLLNDFRNGIILFRLMEEELWSEEKRNEDAIQQFFRENKTKYSSPDELLLSVYTIDEDDGRTKRKLQRAFRKGTVERTVTELNNRERNAVRVTEKKLTLDDAEKIDTDLTTIGEYVKQENEETIAFLQSKQIIPGAPKTFSEVKSEVMMDFQKETEQEWIDRLKERHPVRINEEVLQTLYR